MNYLRNLAISLVAMSAISVSASGEPAPAACDIRSFGAVADDARADTAAIQAAIDACAGSGQPVVVPAGRFDSGGLTLRSNLYLHVSGGARLAMSINYDDYAPRAAIEGHRALLFGDQVSNVEIGGTGVIDGMAAPIYAAMDRIIASNPDDPEADRRARWGLMLSRCSNVRVRDITIRDTPMFLMAVRQCDNVVLDGFTLDAPIDSHNTDGLQIIDSSDVRVTNCRISAGDDGITTKAQGVKAIERLIVDNCVIRSDDGAIKLGTQSRGVLRDSLFNNIAIVDSRYGIAAFMIRGGLYANNRFTNIRIAIGGRHRRGYPIFVDVDDRERNAQSGGVGRIDGLVFDNLDITTGGNMLIAGHPQSPIRDLTLSNVRFRSTGKDPIAATDRKPTGNRKFRPVAGAADYAPIDAHLVIGEAAGVRLMNVDIEGGAGGARERLALRNVKRLVAERNSAD
jgi:polygalacturonase